MQVTSKVLFLYVYTCMYMIMQATSKVRFLYNHILQVYDYARNVLKYLTCIIIYIQVYTCKKRTLVRFLYNHIHTSIYIQETYFRRTCIIIYIQVYTYKKSTSRRTFLVSYTCMYMIMKSTLKYVNNHNIQVYTYKKSTLDVTSIMYIHTSIYIQEKYFRR